MIGAWKAWVLVFPAGLICLGILTATPALYDILAIALWTAILKENS